MYGYLIFLIQSLIVETLGTFQFAIDYKYCNQLAIDYKYSVEHLCIHIFSNLSTHLYDEFLEWDCWVEGYSPLEKW